MDIGHVLNFVTMARVANRPMQVQTHSMCLCPVYTVKGREWLMTKTFGSRGIEMRVRQGEEHKSMSRSIGDVPEKDQKRPQGRFSRLKAAMGGKHEPEARRSK